MYVTVRFLLACTCLMRLLKAFWKCIRPIWAFKGFVVCLALTCLLNEVAQFAKSGTLRGYQWLKGKCLNEGFGVMIRYDNLIFCKIITGCLQFDNYTLHFWPKEAKICFVWKCKLFQGAEFKFEMMEPKNGVGRFINQVSKLQPDNFLHIFSYVDYSTQIR